MPPTVSREEQKQRYRQYQEAARDIYAFNNGVERVQIALPHAHVQVCEDGAFVEAVVWVPEEALNVPFKARNLTLQSVLKRVDDEITSVLATIDAAIDTQRVTALGTSVVFTNAHCPKCHARYRLDKDALQLCSTLDVNGKRCAGIIEMDA